MEPPTPAPEDEFEFYFQKAAKNKHLVHIQLTHDPEPRRGSLPSAVASSADARVELLPVITVAENSHHRAASCKATPKSPSKQIRHSPSARLASEKRPSYGDVRSAAAPGNGFLSPSFAGGDDAAAAAMSTSAPQSRSGSFRRASRDGGGVKDSAGGGGGGDGAASLLSSTAAGGGSRERRRSSVYLEETVAAKLRELKQMEDENCLVVRQFTMSPQGDIINRVDSFKKKRESSPKASSSSSSTTTSKQQQQQPEGGRLLLQVPGQELRLPGRPAILPRLISCEPPRRVLVIGDRRVGKTALMQQFMTSEYLAALDTSFDTDATDEKSVSVCVDGEEMTLQFTDLEPEEQLEHRQLHPDVDCYLLVYSIADKKSFAYISSLLHDLSVLRRTFAVIIVANKSDVVRKRQVNDTEAMDVCTRFSAKFIEVSAALNHKVDELLIGIVNQIRLNPNRRQRLESSAAGGGGGSLLPDEPPTPTAVACSKGTRSFLSKLFFSKKKKNKERRPCENLQTL